MVKVIYVGLFNWFNTLSSIDILPMVHECKPQKHVIGQWGHDKIKKTRSPDVNLCSLNMDSMRVSESAVVGLLQSISTY